MAVLGIDIGTTSIKTCVVVGDRKIVYEGSAPHGGELRLGEQDASKIIQKACFALEEAIKTYNRFPSQFGEVTRLRIAGQMHGIVAWDSEKLQKGIIKSSLLYTWMFPNDPEAMKSLPKPSRPVFPGFGSVTLLEKKLFKDFDRCGTIMDLFYCYLCEIEEVVISWQLAESWGYCSHGKWDNSLVEAVKSNNFKLPEIVEDDQFVVGKISSSRLEEFRNLEVLIPLGDLQASIKSVADENLEVAYLILGTSSQICVIAEKDMVVDCPTVDTLPFSTNKIILAGRSMNGGNAIDAILKLISSWTAEIGGTTTTSTAPNIEKLLDSVDHAFPLKNPHSSSLNPSVMPAFIQERGLRPTGASITGLDHNTTLVQVVAALCSGVIDNLLTLFPLEMVASLGIKKLYMVGNAKKARFSKRIEELCSKVGITAVPAENDTSAAYGAALF